MLRSRFFFGTSVKLSSWLRLLQGCSLIESVQATSNQLRSEFFKTTAYTNPIISGFAPDPSCIRVDGQFFCVTSSFSAFPGIPVYTSRDLVQWKQIGNVLSRPEQVPTLSLVNQSTGGIWAATIRYHDSRFYVMTTLVFDGAPQDSPSRWDNMVFSTEDIFANNGNGWSDPIHFTFQGYDTSLFWDDDERVYVQGSHAWRVFPAIQQFEIDLVTGESLSGDPVTIWTGTGGLAPEGPHLYKRSDGYYLLIAEGGTGLNHMVTMARSINIYGPYDPCPYNPVLTNANTTEYLQTVGHADLFQDANNNWWAVALATRNGTVNFPMGRETVIVPVVWDEGQFPVFNAGKPGRVHVNMRGPLPFRQSPTLFPDSDPLVGHSQHITFSPDAPLPRQLVYYRLPDPDAYAVIPVQHSMMPQIASQTERRANLDSGVLRMSGTKANLTSVNAGAGTMSFIARRQDALLFTASVVLNSMPRVPDEEAGLTVFLQRGMHFDLGVVGVLDNRMTGASEGRNVALAVRLRVMTANSSVDGMSDPFSQPGVVLLRNGSGPIQLRVQAENASTYVFSFRTVEAGSWTVVGYGAAREVSGGFTGTLVGMYATGNGRNSTSPADFNDFKYDPVAEVF